MGEEHPEARGTTCHQCAALAEELEQMRAELAAANTCVADLMAELLQVKAAFDGAKKDAMRFNALRRIRSFHAGVFLLADPDSGQEIVAVPTETICYSIFAAGCDERDAVDNAIKIMRAEQEASSTASPATNKGEGPQ